MTIDTDAPSTDDVDQPAAPPTVTEIPYGAAQATWVTWLALLSVLAFAFSVVALVVAIAKDGGTTIAAPAGPSAAASSLTVEGGEWFFDLDSAAIVADTSVPVTFNNTGDVEHELVLLEQGARPADESLLRDDMILDRIGPIQPGETASGAYELSPGEYLLVCAISGHYDAGMFTDLTVAS